MVLSLFHVKVLIKHFVFWYCFRWFVWNILGGACQMFWWLLFKFLITLARGAYISLFGWLVYLKIHDSRLQGAQISLPATLFYNLNPIRRSLLLMIIRKLAYLLIIQFHRLYINLNTLFLPLFQMSLVLFIQSILPHLYFFIILFLIFEPLSWLFVHPKHL